jgi:hypothetical protein
VIAPASTGRDNNNNTAVTTTAHPNKANLCSLIPGLLILFGGTSAGLRITSISLGMIWRHGSDAFTFGMHWNTDHALWGPQCNGTNDLNLGFWQTSRSTDPWEQASIVQLSRDFYTTAKRIAGM